MHAATDQFCRGELDMTPACELLQLDFWAALDGELKDERAAEVAAHLGICADCRNAARDAVTMHRRLLENAKPVLAQRAAPELKSLAAMPNQRKLAPEPTASGRRVFVLDWRAYLVASLMLLGLTIFIYHRYGPGHSDLAPLAATVRLESFSGNVRIITEYVDVKQDAQANMPLTANDGIEIQGAGQAVIRYNDGTRVTLNSQAVARLYLRTLKDLTASNLRRGSGKRVTLEAGSIEAEVMPQSSQNPMVFGTAQAEMLIVGTKLKIFAGVDSTRLDVVEGEVKLARRSDNVTVSVSKNQYTIAPWSGEIVVKTLN
jgi:ferric-dicitrate binding protein FerR (iron transport regulator)